MSAPLRKPWRRRGQPGPQLHPPARQVLHGGMGPAKCVTRSPARARHPASLADPEGPRLRGRSWRGPSASPTSRRASRRAIRVRAVRALGTPHHLDEISSLSRSRSSPPARRSLARDVRSMSCPAVSRGRIGRRTEGGGGAAELGLKGGCRIRGTRQPGEAAPARRRPRRPRMEAVPRTSFHKSRTSPASVPPPVAGSMNMTYGSPCGPRHVAVLDPCRPRPRPAGPARIPPHH